MNSDLKVSFIIRRETIKRYMEKYLCSYEWALTSILDYYLNKPTDLVSHLPTTDGNISVTIKYYNGVANDINRIREIFEKDLETHNDITLTFDEAKYLSLIIERLLRGDDMSCYSGSLNNPGLYQLYNKINTTIYKAGLK